MKSIFSFQSCLLAFSLLRLAASDCHSTGTDYVDGGGPYCVNSALSDYFSFGTEWEGCSASDTQGGVTPILIAPNSDEFFCSDIATNPDDTEMRSTCNVAGNEVRKNTMQSGTWIVVLEGLTFAWMRTFNLNVGPQITTTSTPTATFTVTSTPSATSTSTNTAVITTTLTASTVTVPSTTLTKTSTITPAPVTVTVTSLLSLTNIQLAFATTVKTVTVTTSCVTKLGPWDPKCTIKPTKAKLTAATSAAKLRPRGRLWAQEMRQKAAARGLLEVRSLDQCTSTILATANLPSTTLTVAAPTKTIVVVTDVTSTATVTPPPVTSLSGKASVTITITKPTQTITKISRGITILTITNTIFATLTSTIKVKPTGAICIGS